MVDEKEELRDKEEGEETSKGKKAKAKLVLIAVAAALVLGGGGFGVYKFVLEKPPETVGEEEPQKKKTMSKKDLDQIVGTMFPLEAFLVNIDDEDETRFLKTKLTLELDSESMIEEVNRRLAQIRDNILLLLSSKDFSEIRSLDGKYILREEILEQLNSMLITGKLKNIYFTEFVVQ